MSSISLPSGRSVTSLLQTLRQIAYSGLRLYFLDSLTEGTIDLRPLSRTLRTLTIAGLALVIPFLGVILFADTLRQNGTLEVLSSASGGRGLYIPPLAVPLTLIAMTLAWGYLLTGALHTRPVARRLIFLAYLLFGLGPLTPGFLPAIALLSTLHAALVGVLLVALLILLVLAFIIFPRIHAPLALEFGAMLALVSAFVIISLYFMGLGQLASANGLVGSLISDIVGMTFVLTIPFMVISGIEMANFGMDATGWVAKSLQRHGVGWIPVVFLGIFLAFRLYALFGYITSAISLRQCMHWLGAAIVLAGFIPILLWRRRRPEGDRVPYRLLVALIVGLQLFQLLLTALLLPLASGGFLLALGQNSAANLSDLFAPILAASDVYHQNYSLVVGIVGLVVALLAYRRAQYAVAAFGMILAWVQLELVLIGDGAVLSSLHYVYSDIDAVLLVVLAVLSLYWLVRRQLTRNRALRLLAIAILAALLNSTGFLSSPFSPLLGFAGVFFLVFGILWSVLTAGGKFANTGTPDFPRASRLLLYLGYVLLTVAVSYWFNISHNTLYQINSNGFSNTGFVVFGLAIAYLAIIDCGAPLLEADLTP